MKSVEKNENFVKYVYTILRDDYLAQDYSQESAEKERKANTLINNLKIEKKAFSFFAAREFPKVPKGFVVTDVTKKLAFFYKDFLQWEQKRTKEGHPSDLSSK